MKKVFVTTIVVFLVIIFMLQFIFSSGLSSDGMWASQLIIKVLDKNNAEVKHANVIMTPLFHSILAEYQDHNAPQKTGEEGTVVFYRRGGWGSEAMGFWAEHGASFRELTFKITKEGYQDEILNIKREKYRWHKVFGFNLLGAPPPRLFEYTVVLKAAHSTLNN